MNDPWEGPVESCDNLLCGFDAEAVHPRQEHPQPLRVHEASLKRTIVLTIILAATGSKRVAERAPQTIELGVRDFQDAANVAELGGIEEQVGRLGIAVHAVVTPQQLERHQRVKEIARGPRMQSKLCLQIVKCSRRSR
jgi:hypothetical protein